MPSFRIGYGSDFTIDSNGVGIGTTFAASGTKLDVVGTLKGDFNITGVTTLTAYGGFVAQNQHINKPAAIGFGTVGVGTHQQYYETTTEFTDLGGVHHGDDQRFNTLSEDLVIDDGQILNITNTDMVGLTTIGEQDPHSHSSYVCAGSLEQVSVTGHFSVPNGGSNDRKDNPIEGTVRFNTDLNTLEFFNGNEWRQFTYNQGQSGRAIFSGGADDSSDLQVIDYYNIHTTGNAVYFGDATLTESRKAGCSSAIRGLSGGTDDSSNHDTIDYVTIASAGNAIDFGNLYNGRGTCASMSSSTRGLWAGGRSPTNQDTIDDVEIATIGNALDFGDITQSRQWLAGCSSSTRGIIGGGESPAFASPTRTSRIEYITMASKGNAVIFGELTGITGNPGGCSNSTRGFFGGGEPQTYSKIDMITIASTGNAVHFGDLTVARLGVNGAGSQTRATFLGGHNNKNTIDYITMSTLGNAQDFGDLTIGRWSGASFSDCHGGLGGF